jgi:membrane protein DedA with SNARE-associated domain
MRDRDSETETQEKKPRRLRWRWILMAVILIAVVSTSVIVLREEFDRFAKFGYLGAFLISILASATVITFIPSVPLIFALGGALNPFYVGLAAGAGEALGELIIYTAGRTGHAFFLKDRFIEAQANKEARGIYPRLQRWIHARGALALFLASAIWNPFFSLISATAGATRFPAWKFLGAVWAGKTVKWTVVAILGKALLDYILIRWFNI